MNGSILRGAWSPSPLLGLRVKTSATAGMLNRSNGINAGHEAVSSARSGAATILRLSDMESSAEIAYGCQDAKPRLEFLIGDSHGNLDSNLRRERSRRSSVQMQDILCAIL
jgi:hypothetical protein